MKEYKEKSFFRLPKINKWFRLTAIALALIITCNSILQYHVKRSDSQNRIQSLAAKLQEVQDLAYQPKEKSQLEKSSEKLAGKYKKMQNAFDSGDYQNVTGIAEQAKTDLKAYKAEIDEQLKINRKTVDKLHSAKASKAQETYEQQISEKMTSLEKAIDRLSAVNSGLAAKSLSASEKKSAKNALLVLNDAFTEKEIHNPLGSQVPHQLVESEVDTEQASSTDAHSSATQLPAKRSAVLAENDPQYIALTDEMQLSDEIKAKADELNTPLAIYEYLKNNINYESYYGSRKGAIGTFEQMGGNDMDSASLLSAMLRYKGYPTRYISGTVEMTVEQAQKLTGAEDANSAARVLASQGRSVTAMTTGGKVVSVRLEQTWVEAYVPYGDYRGAGDVTGEEMWIPMDVSVKAHEKQETIFDKMTDEGINAELEQAKSDGMDAINALMSKWEQQITSEGDQAVVNSQKIVPENLGLLPSTLQYEIIQEKNIFSSISDSLSDGLTFSMGSGNTIFKKSVELNGKKLVLEYVPATEYDQDVLDAYGDIFKVPSYLMKVKPVIKADGVQIWQGQTASPGETQTFNMKVVSGRTENAISNTLIAGSMYQLSMDMQSVSADQLDRVREEACANAESVDEENVYSEEYLGSLLQVAGTTYFAQLDVVNHFLAEAMGVETNRSLSVGMTGYSVKPKSIMGVPSGVDEGGLIIDVDLDSHSVVSADGDKEAEKQFMMASGMMSSSFEHVIWEEVADIESVSTMKALENAKEQGVEILMLSKANWNAEKSKLNVSAGVYADVQTAVNDGKIVTIPVKETNIGTWKGSGYIVMDADTGAAGYMISGGLAGGATTEDVTVAYMVNIGLSIIDMIEIMLMMSAAITAIAAGSLLGGFALLGVSLICLVFAIEMYFTAIDLMCAYMLGDEAAGQKLIEESWLNLGITIGTGILSALAKPFIKLVLKNKLVKNLGEEIVEKLLKNTDDIAGLNKIVNQLKKSGVADDIIKNVADNYGDDGLKWLQKWINAGYTDDLLEKIVESGLDLTKISDDLMKILKDSKYADDIIEAITTYGDEAADLITKYGDDAARVINKYGDDGIELINEFGRDAARHIADYGDNAFRAISEYGDDAIEIINESGAAGVRRLTEVVEFKDAIAALNSQHIKPFHCRQFAIEMSRIAEKSGSEITFRIMRLTDEAFDELLERAKYPELYPNYSIPEITTPNGNLVAEEFGLHVYVEINGFKFDNFNPDGIRDLVLIPNPKDAYMLTSSELLTEDSLSAALGISKGEYLPVD